MYLGIRGRTALVLGGGGGLGSAIARGLAAEVMNVAIADIEQEALKRTVSSIEALNVRAMSLPWDLSDLSLIEKNVSAVENELGAVDVLVNITGGPPPTPAAGQDIALWNKYFAAMVAAVIAITDRVLPKMKARAWGRIITSTSSGVVSPISNLGLSNSLRLSLVGWSKPWLARLHVTGSRRTLSYPGESQQTEFTS